MASSSVLAVLALLGTVTGSSADRCVKLGLRCRQEGHNAKHELHCTHDGHVFPDRCTFLEARCRGGATLLATGDRCLQALPARAARAQSVSGISDFERNFFRAVTRGIDDRLKLSDQNHVTPEKAKAIFNVRDAKNAHYERNVDCWAYGLGLSAISPWNSQAGPMMGGTLLSPRHLIWARHFSLRVNTTMRFVDDANHVHERRLVDVMIIDLDHDKDFWGEDLALGVLDSDLPATVDFARVLPPDLVYLHPQSEVKLPVLSTDQEAKALVTDFAFERFYAVVTRRPNRTSLRYEFYEDKVGGDSGQPAFFVINGELVIIFLNTLGGPGTGTPVVSYYNLINGMMRRMGGGYQLTTVNLDNYGNRSHIKASYEASMFTPRPLVVGK